MYWKCKSKILVCAGFLFLFSPLFGEFERYWPIKIEARFSENMPLSGPVTLILTALPDHDCQSVILNIKDINNIDYKGNREFEKRYISGTPVLFEVPFILPANDTCGFALTFATNREVTTYKIHWSTTNDTLKTFWDHPRNAIETKLANMKQTIDSTFVKKAEWAKSHPNGIIIHTFSDEYGNMLTEDEYKLYMEDKQKIKDSLDKFNSRVILYDTTVSHIRTDSGLIPIKNTEAREYLRRLEMKELEKSPLETDDVQLFYVTKEEVYIRNKGESTFTSLDVKRAEWQEYLTRKELLEGESSVTLKRRILDLRNSDDYETAVSIVDSLIPSGEAGFFEVLISGKQYEELRKNGIRPQKISKHN